MTVHGDERSVTTFIENVRFDSMQTLSIGRWRGRISPIAAMIHVAMGSLLLRRIARKKWNSQTDFQKSGVAAVGTEELLPL